MKRMINKEDPFSYFLEIIFSRKLLIILCFLSVFGLTIIGAIFTPPVYEAYTTIYINAPALPEIDVPYIMEIKGRSFLDTQTRIIQSRFIFEKVVRKLNIHKRKIKKKWHENIKKSIFDYLKGSESTSDPIEQAIAELKKYVSIKRERGSNIVTIKVKSKLSERSALIANTLANTYIEYANNFLFNKAQSAYNFMEKKVENARNKYAESEKKLNEYKKRHTALSLPEEKTFIIKKLTEIDEQYDMIEQEIKEYQIKNVKGDLKTVNNKIYEYPENKSVSDNLAKELDEKLTELELELDQRLIYLKEEHPDIKIIRKRMAQLEDMIEKEKRNRKIYTETTNRIKSDKNVEGKNSETPEIENLLSEMKYLSKQKKKLMAKSEKLTKIQLNIEKLSREFENNKSTLMILETKLEDAYILKANENTQGTIKIIDKAFPPPFPTTKKKKILIILGMIAAIIFSIGMTFIAEYLDDSLKTPDEAKDYLDVPVLGVVPRVTKKLMKI
jgi:uncharacterized protein involved in exopolysaccharide biosynthesis